MRRTLMNVEMIKSNIKKILTDKKALDVTEICVKDETIITDYFVLASGTSATHIKSLSDNLEYELSKLNIKARQIEGDKNCGWILMDYGDVIVHIFLPEVRERYRLDVRKDFNLTNSN